MFRLNTAWNLGAFGHVALPQHDCPAGADQFSVTVGWLDEEHGMQTCHRIGDILPVFSLWLSYLQFEFDGLCIGWFIDSWSSGLMRFSMQVQHLHDNVLKVYAKVVSYQMISSKFKIKLLGLL